MLLRSCFTCKSREAINAPLDLQLNSQPVNSLAACVGLLLCFCCLVTSAHSSLACTIMFIIYSLVRVCASIYSYRRCVLVLVPIYLQPVGTIAYMRYVIDSHQACARANGHAFCMWKQFRGIKFLWCSINPRLKTSTSKILGYTVIFIHMHAGTFRTKVLQSKWIIKNHAIYTYIIVL